MRANRVQRRLRIRQPRPRGIDIGRAHQRLAPLIQTFDFDLRLPHFVGFLLDFAGGGGLLRLQAL